MAEVAPETEGTRLVRRILWFGASIKLVMFVAEGAVGAWIGSAALLAGATVMVGDMAAFGLPLVAAGWTPRDLSWMGKILSVTMGLVGLAALGEVARRIGVKAPDPRVVCGLALVALGASLFGFSHGSRSRPKPGRAGRRSPSLEVMLNVVTLASSGLCAWTNRGWPDALAGLLVCSVSFWTARGDLMAAWRKAPTRS